MFRKLSDSLTSPKLVAKYYKEPLWKTLFLFIILLFFIMIPVVINLINHNFITNSFKSEIKRSFINEEIPFKIEDGIIKNINGDSEFVYTNDNMEGYKIIFTENISNLSSDFETILIVFCNDGVYMKASIASQNIVKFSDYEYFKNIDFSNKEIFENYEIWDNTFSVMRKVYDDTKLGYIMFLTIYYFIYWFVWLLVFCLVISLFSKMRVFGALKYWDLYKISIYSLTPFVICSVFSSLFNLGILIYVGYFLSAIYNIITVNEVLKNTYSVRREGE